MIAIRPFSNGTEERAWMATWCEYCVHDHSMHDPNGENGCGLVYNHMIGQDGANEAWIAEPDDGRFFLPSRMICLAFEPCTEDDCTGDPGAADRAERVAEVQNYWRNSLAPNPKADPS